MEMPSVSNSGSNVTAVNTNCMDVTVTDSVFYDRTDKIIITVIMPTILIIGLMGNVTFLVVVTLVQRMRTITNLYLQSLAVSDIIFLIVAIGEKLWRYLSSPYVDDQSMMGQIGCIVVYFITDMTFYSSVFLVTLAAVERFYAICRPLKHRMKIGAKERTIRLIASAWVLAFCLSMLVSPSNWGNKSYCLWWISNGTNSPSSSESFPSENDPYYHNGRMFQCTGITPWYVSFGACVQTLPFFTAFIANCTLYYNIIHSLNRRVGTADRQRPNTKNLRIRNQVARMLIVNGLVFFICLAPFEILSLVVTSETITNIVVLTQEQYNMWGEFARLMLYVNSAVNPIVYNLMSKRYRQAYCDALKCHVRRKLFRTNSEDSGSKKNGRNTLTVTHQLHNLLTTAT
ncbi:gastrin/cholecystokinin type B receptor-like [Anneissia japonica]|uniref:gastrin/cholecystokinin type B receptor-like n=1 Tax=Anneissia japonica TaxID=1529436 RepID=UPI001425505B|nr:gastrin/cholecystokinin type B receptor-like [Anneissia japonica]